MKHRDVNYSTRHLPGYNAPAAAKSHKGGGYPHKQRFDSKLAVNQSKKRSRKS